MKTTIAISLILGSITPIITPPTAFAQLRAQSGHGGGNGGESVDKILRDLVDNSVCKWSTGDDMRKIVSPTLDSILNQLKSKIEVDGKIERPIASLFLGVQKELSKVVWCKTEAPLFRVDTTDANSVVTAYEGKTTQIAVRVKDKIFLDMVQFRKLEPKSQAYLFIHEALHTLVKDNDVGHNSQVRSLVKAIEEYLAQELTRPEFLLNTQINGLTILDAEILARAVFDSGHSLKSLYQSGFSISKLRAAGFKANDFYKEGFKIAALTNGFSVVEIRAGKYSLKQFVDEKIPLGDISKAFSLKEVLGFGLARKDVSFHYTNTELKANGFTVKELLSYGFYVHYDLRRSIYRTEYNEYCYYDCRTSMGRIDAFTFQEMVDSGIKLAQLKWHFPIQTLYKYFPPAEVKAEYELYKLEFVYTLKELVEMGVKKEDLLALVGQEAFDWSKSDIRKAYRKYGR